MPCFHPRSVWRSPKVCRSDSGKPRIFFRKPLLFYSTPRHVEHYLPEEFSIPGCKPKCVGCQEIYSRSWAVRAWHESTRHDSNCFITLTFNDESCPEGLDHRFWQLFMKRFRKAIDVPISFFMAGEYGSLNFRPHFHACIFGFDFPDKVFWSQRDDVRLYTSEMLGKLWSDPDSGVSYGFSSVGDVSFESAAYIARYVGKKAQRAELPPGLRPEYSKCSLKRPIGKDWFNSYKDSVYPDDAVTMANGSLCKPPRYYDKLLALTDPVMSTTILNVRKYRADNSPDNSPERLRAREKVKQAQISQLKRSL